MGIKERRAREKERRRNSIIDAAEKVFFSKGLNQATMDEVAETAELSKGTLYLYFKSKEDLYLAIVLRAHKLIHSMFEEEMDKAETGREKVRAMGSAYFGFYHKYPDYFEAILYYENYEHKFNDQNPYARECHQSNKKSMKLLANVIQLGVEDGTIRNDLEDPWRIAFSLWGQSMGIVQLVSLRGNLLREKLQMKPEELIDSFFNLMDHALKA